MKTAEHAAEEKDNELCEKGKGPTNVAVESDADIEDQVRSISDDQDASIWRKQRLRKKNTKNGDAERKRIAPEYIVSGVNQGEECVFVWILNMCVCQRARRKRRRRLLEAVAARRRAPRSPKSTFRTATLATTRGTARRKRARPRRRPSAAGCWRRSGASWQRRMRGDDRSWRRRRRD